MDVAIYLKQRVPQPQGDIDVPEDNIFDFKPVYDGNTITDLLLVEDEQELQQASFFTSLKQYGGNPLYPTQGIRWAESLIEEYPAELLVEDIRNAVQQISESCKVVFSSVTVDGQPLLTFDIKVVS